MAKVEVNRIGIPRAPLLESWEGEKQSEERSKKKAEEGLLYACKRGFV